MEATILKELIALFQLPNITLGISMLALYAYRSLKEHFVKKRARRTETLQKLVEFYKDYKGEQRSFLAEQLYYNHFGVLLSHRDLKFFLRTSKPSFFIQQYLCARQFLQISVDESRVEPKPGIRLSRERYKGLAWYGACGMGAVMLLLNSHAAFTALGPELYAPWVVVLLSLAALAWIGMDSTTNASTAEKLIRELQTEPPPEALLPEDLVPQQPLGAQRAEELREEA